MQVYVVAMNNQKLEESATQNEEQNNTQESLLRLVAPELALLSTYWLAFLKDYALLSLPPGKKKYILKVVILCDTLLLMFIIGKTNFFFLSDEFIL